MAAVIDREAIKALRSTGRVAIIGVGGLGAPVMLALAHAGVGTLIAFDDDAVDRSNLHRQILFRDADVGRSKLDAAADAIARRHPSTHVEKHAARLHPGTTGALAGVDVIVECSDNYATKFLAADAARLQGKPIVHGAAVRWIGTAFAVGPLGGPCYRCLFEDVPEGAQAGCDVAGVVGPVCGVIGAILADFALRILDAATTGGEPPFGTLATFDGLHDDLRVRTVARRNRCALCGVPPTIDSIDPARYEARP